MLILAVESSCDETAVALVRDGREVLTDCISSQVELHRIYGGVVPEIASRKHIECIYALADQALARAGVTRQDIDAVAVTYAPGLIGAVLVGVNFAKAAALRLGVPLIPVHHIRGHIAANYLALAGECFDKVARVLGMPYPGGAALDRTARQGVEGHYDLPRAKLSGNPLDMSFSGLKTAALNLIHHAGQVGEALNIPDLCADFSRAVSDTLVPRTMQALRDTGYKKLAIAGGVAANSRIRADFAAAAAEAGAALYIPPLSLCGDNAAMIGAQGYYEYLAGNTAGQDLNAFATKTLEGEAV